MSTTLLYFLGYSMVYILLTWALYLAYRVSHLHFLIVAIMAVTSYFSGIATVKWGWSIYLALIVGIILGGFISYLISLGIGDAPTFTVVMVGVTFIYIVKTVIENTDYLGGTMGLFGIPFLEKPLITMGLIVVLTGYLIYRIEHSRLGRAATVVFKDKDMAASLGIEVKKLGMFFQTISGAIAGSAGVLYAHFTGSLFPDFFSFHLVGTLMTMLFIGGYSTMWGPVFSALILGGIPLLLPSAVSSWKILIYGVLLVIIILVKPKGLITKKMIWRITQRR